MARGNRLKGSRLRGKFDAAKHPRGYHGRFIETPDQPKKSLRRARVAQTESGSRRILLGNTTREQRLALLKKFLDAERLKQTQIYQDFQKLPKARVNQTDDGGTTKIFLTKLNRLQLERLALALVKQQGGDVEGIKPTLKRLSDTQLRKLLEVYSRWHSEPEATVVPDVEPKPEPAKKTKRSRLSPEDKAAKEKAEADKKAERAAAKATKAAEKEAEKAAKEAQAKEKDTKAKQSVSKLLTKLSKVERVEPRYKYGIKAENGMPATPTSKTPIPATTKTDLHIRDNRVEIWKDQPEYSKRSGNWKERRERNYKYEVDVDGVKLTLNRSENGAVFEGERVHGLPTLHHKLRELDNEVLFSRLAKYAGYVEGHVDNKLKHGTPAPEWLPTIHGSIPREYMKDGKVDYGKVEIHHINQWAEKSFTEITSKLKYNPKTKTYEDGEITLDEAKRRQRELLTWVDNEKTDDGYFTGWRIKIAPQDQRELVALAAGTHNVRSQLDGYLHVPGIDLDTGKPKDYGIPYAGEHGREWFNGWRKRFWAEYYKREVFILQGEANRRMRKGLLTKDEAQAYWELGKVKTKSTYAVMKKDQENTQGYKKAIYEDFLDERVLWNGSYI